jgi:prevent-host-death family protein
MKTMTAKDAKNKFGEMLDTTQREPVMLTKNDRPVAIVLSIHDAETSLVSEIFMNKEEGYDDWAKAKIAQSLEAHKAGKLKVSDHHEVMERMSQLFEKQP